MFSTENQAFPAGSFFSLTPDSLLLIISLKKYKKSISWDKGMDDTSSDNRRPISGSDSDNLQPLEKQLRDLQEENRELSDLFEETISRSNTLTMEVEIARLEFEQIFNSVGDATWVINDRFGVVRINQAFLTLIGLKEKEAALSRNCFDLFPSPMCKTPRCPMDRAFFTDRHALVRISRRAGGHR
jgi:PAS domain-containing protein